MSETPTSAAVMGPADVAGLSFDAALAELDSVVKSLESGGQPLEEALLLYERGVALHEHCARLLSDAELRVRRLVERAGGALETVAGDGISTVAATGSSSGSEPV
jgi:exodeoxyribonuclease VII small subunit